MNTTKIKQIINKFKKQLGINNKKFSIQVLEKIQSFLNDENNIFNFNNEIEKIIVLKYCQFVQKNKTMSVDEFLKQNSKFGKPSYKIQKEFLQEEPITLKHFFGEIYFLTWPDRLDDLFVSFSDIQDLEKFVDDLQDKFYELEYINDKINIVMQNDYDTEPYYDSMSILEDEYGMELSEMIKLINNHKVII